LIQPLTNISVVAPPSEHLSIVNAFFSPDRIHNKEILLYRLISVRISQGKFKCIQKIHEAVYFFPMKENNGLFVGIINQLYSAVVLLDYRINK
jgi:hypothetical protein